MSDPISGAGVRPGVFTGADVGVSTQPAAKTGGATATLIDGTAHVPGGKAGAGASPAELLRKPGSGASEAAAQASLMQGMAGSDANLTGDIFAVMALFQQMAQQMRGAARETRQAEMTSQVSSLQSAAEQIRSAAQDRFDGAVTAGAMQIGAGALSIGAGAYSGSKAVAGGKAADLAGAQSKAAGGSLADVTAARGEAAKSFDAAAIRMGQYTSGASSALTGTGTIVSAHTDKAAAQHDAQKAKLEASSKVHEAGVSAANDLMQQMMDVIRDVRDKLGAIQQAQVETTRGIARNI